MAPVRSRRNVVLALTASVVVTLVAGTLAVRFVWARLVGPHSDEDSASSAELNLTSPAGFRQVASIALGPQLLVRDGFELYLYSRDTKHKELVAKLPRGSLPNCRPFELSDGTVLVSHANSIYALDVAKRRLTRLASATVMRFLMQRADGKVVVQGSTERLSSPTWSSRLFVFDPTTHQLAPFGPDFGGKLWWAAGNAKGDLVAVATIPSEVSVLDSSGKTLESVGLDCRAPAWHLAFLPGSDQLLYSLSRRGLYRWARPGTELLSRKLEAGVPAKNGAIFAMRQDHELWQIRRAGQGRVLLKVMGHDNDKYNEIGGYQRPPVVSLDGRFLVVQLHRARFRNAIARLSGTFRKHLEPDDRQLFQATIATFVVDLTTRTYASLDAHYDQVLWLPQ